MTDYLINAFNDELQMTHRKATKQELLNEFSFIIITYITPILYARLDKMCKRLY